MPQYLLRCVNEECKYEFTKLCSYSLIETLKCKECGSSIATVPTVCQGKINGYSEANGYSREELSYDGSSPKPF